MISIIVALFIGIITIFIFYNYFKSYNDKEPEAFLKINYIDFKEINYFNAISLTLNNRQIFKKIEEKYSYFDIYGFKKREIIIIELKIINSINKTEKNFKVKIYKNITNILNIKINNDNNIYYNSEIIFYCKNAEQNIKVDDLEYNCHNLKKRKRLLIYNFEEEKINKIVRDNIVSEEKENKALKIIRENYNKLLLLNIYLDDNKSNILIFIEKEKSLIIPTKKEKKIFINFYWKIAKNYYNGTYLKKINEEYKKKLVEQKMVFGQKITNLDDDKNIKIYFSFINQGINTLLENNIISNNSNDYYFILGYLILYRYLEQKNILIDSYWIFVAGIFSRVEHYNKNNYSYIDSMKLIISDTIFINKDKFRDKLIDLEIEELKYYSPYQRGYDFYKNIILNLNEESDLMFIYLQLFSGYEYELMNKEKCFKLSMISIEDVKTRIINDIPNFYYLYSLKRYFNFYYTYDSITQVMLFNENKIINNKNGNNSVMNITIALLHCNGIKLEADNSLICCINKRFELIKKYKSNEIGKYINYFLYNSNYDNVSEILISSSRSNELMNEKYFIGNLDKLNIVVDIIISNEVRNKENNKKY